MSKSADPIEVVDSVDGNTYIAERILSLTADMGYSWDYATNTSDLPPVDAHPKDVEKQLKARGK